MCAWIRIELLWVVFMRQASSAPRTETGLPWYVDYVFACSAFHVFLTSSHRVFSRIIVAFIICHPASLSQQFLHHCRLMRATLVCVMRSTIHTFNSSCMAAEGPPHNTHNKMWVTHNMKILLIKKHCVDYACKSVFLWNPIHNRFLRKLYDFRVLWVHVDPIPARFRDFRYSILQS